MLQSGQQQAGVSVGLDPITAGELLLPGDLERQIEAFAEHYNLKRHDESLSNVTPADAYFGRASTIIRQRKGSNDRPSNIGACNTAS